PVVDGVLEAEALPLRTDLSAVGVDRVRLAVQRREERNARVLLRVVQERVRSLLTLGERDDVAWAELALARRGADRRRARADASPFLVAGVVGGGPELPARRKVVQTAAEALGAERTAEPATEKAKAGTVALFPAFDVVEVDDHRSSSTQPRIVAMSSRL